MTEINVSDIAPAELLAGLYNQSHPQGMGFLQATPDDMTTAEAKAALDGRSYFDYWNGRVMKVEINGETLRTALYDRDNGEGAAQRVVDSIREKQAAA